MKTCLNYLENDPYEYKKVEPMIMGVAEQPPQPKNKIKVKGSVKIEKDFTTGHTKCILGIEISC